MSQQPTPSDVGLPLEPLTLDIERTLRDFVQDGADLDALCAMCDLSDTVQRAVFDAYGEDFYDIGLGADEPQEQLDDTLTDRIVAYLIAAGFIAPDDFVWDDEALAPRHALRPDRRLGFDDMS